IVSITEKTVTQNTTGGAYVKKVIIKALKPGNTTININAGGKTLSCPINVTQRMFNFNQAIASNWGDYYETGTNNFDIYLLESTLSLNSEGKIQGEGNLIYLELYVPLTQNTLAPAD